MQIVAPFCVRHFDSIPLYHFQIEIWLDQYFSCIASSSESSQNSKIIIVWALPSLVLQKMKI